MARPISVDGHDRCVARPIVCFEGDRYCNGEAGSVWRGRLCVAWPIVCMARPIGVAGPIAVCGEDDCAWRSRMCVARPVVCMARPIGVPGPIVVFVVVVVVVVVVED